jgi:hypothetical protein
VLADAVSTGDGLFLGGIYSILPYLNRNVSIRLPSIAVSAVRQARGCTLTSVMSKPSA